MNKKNAIIIIAAGASSRLGQAKQLLPYKGTFLLKYIIEECVAAQIGEVFVILGAKAKEIQPQLADIACSIILNPNWQLGMGTSIACGITNLEIEKYAGAYILLGDQPFFEGDLLSKILQKKQYSQAPIVVCKYALGTGPPVFFEAQFFPELAQLKGDIGAKPIVKKYASQVAFVDFDQGHIDIDTTKDLKWLE